MKPTVSLQQIFNYATCRTILGAKTSLQKISVEDNVKNTEEVDQLYKALLDQFDTLKLGYSDLIIEIQAKVGTDIKLPEFAEPSKRQLLEAVRVFAIKEAGKYNLPTSEEDKTP